MLTRFMKALAARAADDARALQRRYLPADAVAQVAEASARALTRHWLAAHALAELAAARHASSVPALAGPGEPLRVLVAARMGALGPAEESTVLKALTALERLAAEPRERPIQITLCGTEALTRADAEPLAERLFGHQVLDATRISAADVAAWVAQVDVVLTCNDFSSDVAGQADVELAALALGFARARGLPALALGVSSPVERFHPEALSFLKRFASKAHYFPATSGVASSLAAAGLRGAGDSPDSKREAGASLPDRGEIIVLDADPPCGAVGLGTSVLGEAFTLGSLLLGRSHIERPADMPPARPDPATVTSLLEARGLEVRRVHLGAVAPPACEGIGTGEAFTRFLRDLPVPTTVVCLAPAALPELLAAGHVVLDGAPPHAHIPPRPASPPELLLRRIVDDASPALAQLALPAPQAKAPETGVHLDGDEVNP